MTEPLCVLLVANWTGASDDVRKNELKNETIHKRRDGTHDVYPSIPLPSPPTLELEVPIVLQWPRAIPRKPQERRYAYPRYKIERQQYDKLNNLAPGEGAVDVSLLAQGTESLSRIAQLVASIVVVATMYRAGARRATFDVHNAIHSPGMRDQVVAAFRDEHGVEDVQQGGIGEEGLEEEGGDCGALAEDEECGVEEGAVPAVEEGEEGDLGQVGPDEERCQHKGGEDGRGHQAGAEEGEEEGVGGEVGDALWFRQCQTVVFEISLNFWLAGCVLCSPLADIEMGLL